MGDEGVAGRHPYSASCLYHGATVQDHGHRCCSHFSSPVPISPYCIFSLLPPVKRTSSIMLFIHTHHDRSRLTPPHTHKKKKNHPPTKRNKGNEKKIELVNEQKWNYLSIDVIVTLGLLNAVHNRRSLHCQNRNRKKIGLCSSSSCYWSQP